MIAFCMLTLYSMTLLNHLLVLGVFACWKFLHRNHVLPFQSVCHLFLCLTLLHLLGLPLMVLNKNAKREYPDLVILSLSARLAIGFC